MRGFLNQKFGQANLAFFLLVGIFAFASIFLGKNIAYVSLTDSFLLIGGLVVVVLTFFNPRIGLFIIIFTALLFPAIRAGSVGVGGSHARAQDILVRPEDFLLLTIVLTWFIKTAVQKELAVFIKTPLNLPICIYSLICIVSTLYGALIGTSGSVRSLFYLSKYLEYFFLYFMTFSLVENKRQAKFFIVALILTGVITSIYADLHIGSVERVSSPFQDEPNTLGGYLTIMIALIIGLFLQDLSGKFKFFLAVSFLFMIPAFLFTLSRTSYLAIIPMCIALAIFSKQKILIIVLLFFGIVLAAICLPREVHERIEYTFSGEVEEGTKPVVVAGKSLDPSASARINSWQDVLNRWQDHPFFGWGVTGVGFIDGEYFLILGETGLFGIIAFIFLLRSIFKNSKKIYLETKDTFFQGVRLGFLAGFIGLIFFNMGANGFVIIKIMEPFWILTAIVMIIPKLESQEAQAQA
jgi:O-antigen ligase